MNALDRIKEDILRQAAEKADVILAEAAKKAADIRSEAETRCAQRARLHDENTERECREIIERAQSADRQKRRLALLETKNRVIDEVIGEAKMRLSELSDPERFESYWQGDIFINNSLEAAFETRMQEMRDRAFAVLSEES